MFEQIPLTLSQITVIVGFLLILLELFIGIEAGFDLVLIGSILVISGFTGIFTASILVALVIASILSVLYITIGRRKIRQRITILTHRTNIDKLMGQTGRVVRSITPDTPGIVRLGDEDWRAISDQVLYEKDPVEVLAIEGVSVKVKKKTK